MMHTHQKRYYYISSKAGRSGITQYSQDFYQHVLQEKDYIFIDSADTLPDILSRVASKDHVHIELGIFQKKEIEILFTMLRANYKSVAITLHDAPLVKYPYFEFRNPLLNKLSKLYDHLGNNSKTMAAYLKKVKSIYVLSRKGEQAVKKKYRIDNVHYLPHIVNTHNIPAPNPRNNNFIYFGFIGRNKGIEYALQLHEQLLNKQPDSHFYVAGTAIGREMKYYEYLKKTYRQNVHYLGYVSPDELQKVFAKATFSLLLFNDYKFYWPTSGSILHSLRQGKILLTNKVNTIPELIEEEKNGFYLTHHLEKDTQRILDILSDEELITKVRYESYKYLLQHHSPEVVKRNLID